MKTKRPFPRPTRARSGAAIIIVMAILAILGTLLLCNGTVLQGLKSELRLLEEKQQKKFAAPAPAQTPGSAQAPQTPTR